MNTRSFILSALIAGAIIGVLGNLPVLNIINCCLCVFVWVGGASSVLLYRRFQHGAVVSGGQGAGLGAVSGLIGAFVGVVVYSATSFLSIPIFASLAQAFQVEGNLPIQSGVSLGSVAATAFFFLTIDAILYPIFGALSGLIAASLTKGQTTA
jgi:hypothetical protein